MLFWSLTELQVQHRRKEGNTESQNDGRAGKAVAAGARGGAGTAGQRSPGSPGGASPQLPGLHVFPPRARLSSGGASRGPGEHGSPRRDPRGRTAPGTAGTARFRWPSLQTPRSPGEFRRRGRREGPAVPVPRRSIPGSPERAPEGSRHLPLLPWAPSEGTVTFSPRGKGVLPRSLWSCPAVTLLFLQDQEEKRGVCPGSLIRVSSATPSFRKSHHS